jgi:hypothetical protein
MASGNDPEVRLANGIIFTPALDNQKEVWTPLIEHLSRKNSHEHQTG